MADIKKFLDQDGVKFLWSKISMQDYPNNDTLMAVIEAIDETKADKIDLVQSDWNELDETSLSYIKNKPFSTTYSNEYQEQWRAYTSGMTSSNIEKTGAKYIKLDSALYASPSLPAERAECYYHFNGMSIGANDTPPISEWKAFPNMPDGTVTEYGAGFGNLALVDDENEVNTGGFWAIVISRDTVYLVFDSRVSTSAYLILYKNITTENIKQLEDKYIPDTIARMVDIPEIPEGFSGSWNDLTDRPFYDGYELETMLPEITVQPQRMPPGWARYNGNAEELLFELADDDTLEYVVVFNGVEYICRKHSGRFSLGNLSIPGASKEDTGEPFLFVFNVNSRPYDYTLYVKSGGTYTYSIYLRTPVTKQLDEKFIPDTIARVGEVPSFEDLDTVSATAAAATNAVKELVGDTPVSEQISAAVAQKASIQMIIWEDDD